MDTPQGPGEAGAVVPAVTVSPGPLSSPMAASSAVGSSFKGPALEVRHQSGCWAWVGH